MASIKTLKTQLDDITVSKPKYGGKSSFAQCKVTLDGKPLRAKLSGSLFMTPRKQEHDVYGTSFKMGVEFQEDDMIVFETVVEKMGKVVGDEYTAKLPHDNGSMFIKLPTNKVLSDFACDLNVPIRPNKLEHEKISQHMPVTVDLIVGGWFMNNETSDEQKYGLSFNVKKITFATEKPKQKKKRHDGEDIDVPDSGDSASEEPPKKKSHSKKDSAILKGMA